MRERALSLIQAPRGLWLLAGIAGLLAAPALGGGLTTDDHSWSHSIRVEGRWWTLFQITRHEAEPLRNEGALAWWSSPNLEISFLRPLASLTHAIEFRLWPDAPWAMHLTSIVLYVLLIVFAALAYREFLADQPRIAALAALMFAIDDGHAGTVGWISGRNTLLANLCSFAALLLHARGRAAHRAQPGHPPRRALQLASAFCTGLGLFSAEAGLTGFGLLLAYALTFEPGGWARRISTLSPHALVLAIWAGNGTRALLDALPGQPKHIVVLNLPMELISTIAWSVLRRGTAARPSWSVRSYSVTVIRAFTPRQSA